MLVRLKTVVLIKESMHLASWVSVFDYVLRMVQRELSSDPHQCILASAEIKLPLPQNMKLQMNVASHLAFEVYDSEGRAFVKLNKMKRCSLMLCLTTRGASVVVKQQIFTGWKVLNMTAVILVCSDTPHLVHNRLTEVSFLPQQDHNPKRSSKLCKSH